MGSKYFATKEIIWVGVSEKKICGGYVARDALKKIKERVGNGEFRAITDDPKLASKKSDDQEQCTQFIAFCANPENKAFIYKTFL